ncbi:hypothetical protein SAMN05216176_101180 [Nitratireductor indicus]|nr:hypothetical protein SAMN05216176_101180 [Nitratireductor indicus]
MNRILADALSALNIAIAIVVVLGFTYFGYRALSGFGASIGFVVGALTAVLICGYVAYLSLIESHLRKLAGSENPSPENAPAIRREPNF